MKSLAQADGRRVVVLVNGRAPPGAFRAELGRPPPAQDGGKRGGLHPAQAVMSGAG